VQHTAVLWLKLCPTCRALWFHVFSLDMHAIVQSPVVVLSRTLAAPPPASGGAALV
jgi:hypothetical protein